MSLHIVRPPDMSTFQAPVLVFGQSKSPRLVSMVNPHVPVEILCLGAASATDLTLSAFRVVVHVLAMGGREMC
jgi:hypothetical protein